MKIRLALVIASLAILLTSCGGGGDGGGGNTSSQGPVASTSAFPIDGVASTLAQTAYNFTLSGTDASSNTYTTSYTHTPGQPSVFESSPAQTASETSVDKTNGVTISTASGTGYFQTNPYRRVGYVSSTGAYYTVTTSWTAYPLTATVGQSGPVRLQTQYTDSSKSTVFSTGTVTWSLEADTATTAWFCANAVTTYTSSTPNLVTALCSKIDPTGNVLGYKLTASQGGSVFTWK